MTNARIASMFERIADLLAEQNASPFRVRAWRRAATAIRAHDRELADVFRDHGRVGLEAIPHVGQRLTNVIIELIRTGRSGALDRLRGDPVHRLAAIPGLGPTLAERIYHELGVETPEDLEMAAHDGRLAAVPGFGERRLAALRGVLASMLSRRPSHQSPSAPSPAVGLLLDLDAQYRDRANAGSLPKIAPRRFNPTRTAWLPIMHVDRDGFSFTVVYSNTALAHRLGRTRDWVVIYFHDVHGPESQVTVVTETRGPMHGLRVVRGRERECASLYEHRRELADRARTMQSHLM